MSTALLPTFVVTNDLPSPSIEVIPAAMASRLEVAVAEAQAIQKVDASTIGEANAVAIRLHGIHKDILAQGERMKKPINLLKSVIMEVLERAETPVLAAKGTLTAKIGAYNRELSRATEMEELRVREEKRKADEAAAAETRRRQAEADAKAASEAKELQDLLGTPVEPQAVTVAPTTAAHVPTVRIEKAAPSAVVTKKVPKLIIDDPKLVAAAYSVGMEVLVTVDRAAVQRVIDAGLTVPGAHVEMVEQTVMRGSR